MRTRWYRACLWSSSITLVALLVTSLPLGFARSDLTQAVAPSNRVGPLAGPVVIAPGIHLEATDQLIGPMPAGNILDVAVALAPSDSAGLAAETILEYTPGAPEFRHFLRAAEVADRYGPSVSTYATALSYFLGYDLAVTPSPDRLMLTVHGPASEVAAAFGTSFDLYHTDGRVFFSHSTPAVLPRGIPWAGAFGLGNQSVPLPFASLSYSSIGRPAAACSASGDLIPCQVQNAYDVSPLLGAGVNGTGFRVGIVDTYDGTESQTTLQSDFSHFTTQYGLPSGSVSYLYPVPTARNLNATSTGWGLEEALDLQWVRAMAPGAAIDMTFAPDPSGGLYGAVDWLVSHQAVNVISLSWGEPDVGIYNQYAGPCQAACNATSDGSYNILSPVLSDAAAEGIGVFVASGDCGAADGTGGVSTNFPASDPSVTGVGGTVLTATSGGAYVSETAWGGNSSGTVSPGCYNQGGSGGGFSPFPRPWWQAGPGVPTAPAVRGVPDVSLVGGTRVVIYYGGSTTGVSGTSVACPMWAAVEAIADQHAGGPLGFLNPLLYQLLRGSFYSTTFHDIVSGSNGYSASPGWDPVTGIGTPVVGALVPMLSGGVSASGNLLAALRATPRFGSVPLIVSFFASASGGNSPYRLFDVDFGDGNSSLAKSGSINHTYLTPGVYSALAVVFDNQANVSLAAPLAIVVGGGGALTVSLSASTTTPSVGAPVSFTTAVSGGVSPYRFWYAFGDGTYLNWSASASVSHSYGAPGGACAAVVVADSATPSNGGGSNPVSLAVGGASSPACSAPSPLVATLSSAFLAADAPGDFPLHVTVSGGVPPYSVQFASDDPYVSACECGIFRSTGTYPVLAFINDSSNQQTVANLTVTVYPRIVAAFTATSQTGSAPLSVTFSVSASGGHLLNGALTHWSFGDGGSANGTTVTHLYGTPGFYLAMGDLGDQGRGNASEAFLIDVLPTVGGGFALSANIAPAVRTAAGDLVQFTAQASGGSAPYQYRWDLGVNDSAFGPSVNQTYGDFGCVGLGVCPLTIGLGVRQQNGVWVNVSISLSPAVALRSSALVLDDTFPLLGGPTPFRAVGSTSISGISGASVGWNFGDGATAIGTTASHVYLTPGNYTVVETATDRFGDHLVRTHALSITGLPLVAPSVSGGPSASSGIAPFSVNFSVSASGGAGAPFQFVWAFGDGAVANTSSATHTYVAAGRYNATVSATDRAGIIATATYPILVYTSTAVGLRASDSSNSLPAGSRLRVMVLANPTCVSTSVPGCGPGGLPLAFFFVLALGAGGGVPVAATARTDSGGYANLSLTIPAVPGAYHLVVSAVGPNFTGTVFLALNVTQLRGLFGLSISAEDVLIASAILGVLLATVNGLAASRRRRRELQYPP